MRTLKFISIILFLAIIAVSVYIGERHINTKIEETIKNNYENEINVLKDKLNKHSELINSIIKLQDKDETQNNNKEEIQDTSSSEQVEFVYVKENGGITITKYIGNKISVQIPNNIEGLPVLKIGENAFAESKVKNVTLPSNCKEIEWFAFYGCYALTTVYINDSVKVIGYGAFDSCSKSLTIYCSDNSFAKQYAQSFGINYNIFK